MTKFSVSPFLFNINFCVWWKCSGVMLQVANWEVSSTSVYKYYIYFNGSNVYYYITKYANFPIKESTCMECTNCLMKEWKLHVLFVWFGFFFFFLHFILFIFSIINLFISIDWQLEIICHILCTFGMYATWQ